MTRWETGVAYLMLQNIETKYGYAEHSQIQDEIKALKLTANYSEIEIQDS